MRWETMARGAVAGALAVAMSGCSAADDGDEAAASTEGPRSVGLDDRDPEPEPEPEPEPDAPPWEPGDPDDYLRMPGVVLGRDADDRLERWRDWIGCVPAPTPVAPRAETLRCEVPVDGTMVEAIMFDWITAADGDTTQGLTLAALAERELAEVWCEDGALDVVLVTQLSPGVELAMPFPDDGDGSRRAATRQIRGFLDDAMTRSVERAGGDPLEPNHKDTICP